MLINKIIEVNLCDKEIETEAVKLLNSSKDLNIRIITAMVLLKHKLYSVYTEDLLVQSLNHNDIKDLEGSLLIAEYLIRSSSSSIAIEESVKTIIRNCYQKYYFYSQVYKLDACIEEKESLNKSCSNELDLSTLKEVLSKNKESIIPILKLINERVEYYPMALEFLESATKDSYKIEVVNSLIGVLNDANVGNSIKTYSTLVLCKIYPTHPKAVKIIIDVLTNFLEIDSEIFSKILTNLYEIDTSHLYIECTNSQLLRNLELSLSKLINNDDLNITDRLNAAYTLWKINPNNYTSQNFIISQLTNINCTYSIVKDISEKISELIPISNNKQSLFDRILSSLEEEEEIKKWLSIVTCLLKASCNEDRLITEIISGYLHTKSDSIGALLNGIVQNIEYPRFHKLWEASEQKFQTKT